MYSKWILTVTLSVNRSLISMKRPNWMRVTILAGTGHKNMDRLMLPPHIVATGRKDGGRWQHSGRDDRWDQGVD